MQGPHCQHSLKCGESCSTPWETACLRVRCYTRQDRKVSGGHIRPPQTADSGATTICTGIAGAAQMIVTCSHIPSMTLICLQVSWEVK